MVKMLFRLAALFAYCAAVFCVASIHPGLIINVRELLLVCAGSFVLSMPALFLGGAGTTRRFAAFCAQIGVNALITGTLAGSLLVLWYFSNPQKISDDSELSRSFFSVLALGCRPFLYGVILRAVFSGVAGLFPRFGEVQSGEPPPACQLEKTENSRIAESLSRREREVARLACKGFTNAQIAEELYISPVTVKRHMANIFGKTGVKSRRDLAKILEADPENLRLSNTP